jgi:hypothetical protein
MILFFSFKQRAGPAIRDSSPGYRGGVDRSPLNTLNPTPAGSIGLMLLANWRLDTFKD